MRIRTFLTAAMLSLLAATANAADKPPGSWDGLVEVKSKRLDMAYLAPGADFRPYTRIMVDPTQVAFHKDWMKDMNDRRDLSRKVTEEQAKDIIDAARTNFADVFIEVFGKAGYTLVTTPGDDVLRISPGISNLYINAPDVMTAGRSRRTPQTRARRR